MKFINERWCINWKKQKKKTDRSIFQRASSFRLLLSNLLPEKKKLYFSIIFSNHSLFFLGDAWLYFIFPLSTCQRDPREEHTLWWVLLLSHLTSSTWHGRHCPVTSINDLHAGWMCKNWFNAFSTRWKKKKMWKFWNKIVNSTPN